MPWEADVEGHMVLYEEPGDEQYEYQGTTTCSSWPTTSFPLSKWERLWLRLRVWLDRHHIIKIRRQWRKTPWYRFRLWLDYLWTLGWSD